MCLPRLQSSVVRLSASNHAQLARLPALQVLEVVDWLLEVLETVVGRAFLDTGQRDGRQRNARRRSQRRLHRVLHLCELHSFLS